MASMNISAYHALLMLLYRIFVHYLESKGRTLPVPLLTETEAMRLETAELKEIVETLRRSLYS